MTIQMNPAAAAAQQAPTSERRRRFTTSNLGAAAGAQPAEHPNSGPPSCQLQVQRQEQQQLPQGGSSTAGLVGALPPALLGPAAGPAWARAFTLLHDVKASKEQAIGLFRLKLSPLPAAAGDGGDNTTAQPAAVPDAIALAFNDSTAALWLNGGETSNSHSAEHALYRRAPTGIRQVLATVAAAPGTALTSDVAFFVPVARDAGIRAGGTAVEAPGGLARLSCHSSQKDSTRIQRYDATAASTASATTSSRSSRDADDFFRPASPSAPDVDFKACFDPFTAKGKHPSPPPPTGQPASRPTEGHMEAAANVMRTEGGAYADIVDFFVTVEGGSCGSARDAQLALRLQWQRAQQERQQRLQEQKQKRLLQHQQEVEAEERLGKHQEWLRQQQKWKDALQKQQLQQQKQRRLQPPQTQRTGCPGDALASLRQLRTSDPSSNRAILPTIAVSRSTQPRKLTQEQCICVELPTVSPPGASRLLGGRCSYSGQAWGASPLVQPSKSDVCRQQQALLLGILSKSGLTSRAPHLLDPSRHAGSETGSFRNVSTGDCQTLLYSGMRQERLETAFFPPGRTTNVRRTSGEGQVIRPPWGGFQAHERTKGHSHATNIRINSDGEWGMMGHCSNHRLESNTCSRCASASPWYPLGPVTSLLITASALASLLHPAASTFFVSDPACGFNSDGFLAFNTSPVFQALRPLGVCSWGFGSVTPVPSGITGTVDQCLQCAFVPATDPVCPDGYSASGSLGQTWDLVPASGCEISAGCLGIGCPAGSINIEQPFICPNGAWAVRCCPTVPHIMCCRTLQCMSQQAPSGNCLALNSNQDLQPGQALDVPKYAMPTGRACPGELYSFTNMQACQADRTFAPPNYYDACTTLPPPTTDTQGCPVVPGYSFTPWLELEYPEEAVIDDGTPWTLLADPVLARSTAAQDTGLMAARCNLGPGAKSGGAPWCTWFATDGSAQLRSYMPLSQRFATGAGATATSATCRGAYVRLEAQRGADACLRLAGYLFHPYVTAAPLSARPLCSECWNATAVATSCNATGSGCGGFSSMHGMFMGAGGGTSGGGFPTVNMTEAFTTTPCFGSFERVGLAGGAPAELDSLDRLLCGDTSYCDSGAMFYSATVEGDPGGGEGFVDVTVTVTRSVTLPAGLTSPDERSAAVLPVLMRIRSLRFICVNGSELLGGMPRPLFIATPNLQVLSMPGCGLTGALPEEYAQLLSMQALDLSSNALTGPLPTVWSSWRLVMMNLSQNQLSGQVPTSWYSVVPHRSYSEMVLLAATWTGRWLPGAMQVLDLGQNSLWGPLSRHYVQGACSWKEIQVAFMPTIVVAATADSTSNEGKGSQDLLDGMPRWSLSGNAGIQAWSAPYSYANPLATLGETDNKNMCAGYTYLITLALLWGVFFLAVLGIVAWWLIRRWLATRAAKKELALANRDQGAAAGEQGVEGREVQRLESSTHDAESNGGAPAAAVVTAAARAATGTAAATVHDDSDQSQGKQRRGLWAGRLWDRPWVRRAIFLARFAWLLADVALDISLVVWLRDDGDRAEFVVCAVFISLAQAAISVACFINLAPLLCSSLCMLLLLAGPLFVTMPVLAPVLAVWNAYNPNVPLVFWRYMELVEFAVMLIQAPAQSISQSVIFARQNQMGRGMYINQALFITSIMFSLGDMLISIFKLLRYKHGPWRRVIVAITHLNTSRDLTPYKKDFVYYSNFKPETPMLWGDPTREGDGAEPLLLLPEGGGGGHVNSSAGVAAGEGGDVGSRAPGAYGGPTSPLMKQLRQQQSRRGTLQWGPLPRQRLLQAGSNGASSAASLATVAVKSSLAGRARDPRPGTQAGGILKHVNGKDTGGAAMDQQLTNLGSVFSSPVSQPDSGASAASASTSAAATGPDRWRITSGLQAGQSAASRTPSHSSSSSSSTASPLPPAGAQQPSPISPTQGGGQRPPPVSPTNSGAWSGPGRWARPSPHSGWSNRVSAAEPRQAADQVSEPYIMLPNPCFAQDPEGAAADVGVTAPWRPTPLKIPTPPDDDGVGGGMTSGPSTYGVSFSMPMPPSASKMRRSTQSPTASVASPSISFSMPMPPSASQLRRLTQSPSTSAASPHGSEVVNGLIRRTAAAPSPNNPLGPHPAGTFPAARRTSADSPPASPGKQRQGGGRPLSAPHAPLSYAGPPPPLQPPVQSLTASSSSNIQFISPMIPTARSLIPKAGSSLPPRRVPGGPGGSLAAQASRLSASSTYRVETSGASSTAAASATAPVPAVAAAAADPASTAAAAAAASVYASIHAVCSRTSSSTTVLSGTGSVSRSFEPIPDDGPMARRRSSEDI